MLNKCNLTSDYGDAKHQISVRLWRTAMLMYHVMPTEIVAAILINSNAVYH